ncbi:MAG: ABC transporter permease [Cyclobacteriaceae bacterium]
MNKQIKEPAFVKWLISRLIPSSQIEEFLGDLQEVHEERMEMHGKLRASIHYWFDAFHLMVGFSSIGLFKTQNNSTIMLRNMFKIAFRNATRQKQFTTLNILGLTIGVATCIIIGLYVYDENSYDQFHANGDQIYRVNQPNIWGDWTEQISTTGPNVATALREEIPEFEQVTRLMALGSQTVSPGMKEEKTSVFKEERFFAAEENFFDVFSFKFLVGDRATALNNPMNMLLTYETAKRYFGKDLSPEEAIGKMVELKDWDGSWKTYTVTGILDDMPSKSHIQLDVLVSVSSFSELMEMHGWKWIWNTFATYTLVAEGSDIPALIEKMQSLPTKWAAPTTTQIFNQTVEEFTGGLPWRLDLQPLDQIYISGSPSNTFGPTGNPQFVKIFGAIGFLVLVLSVINFMNLSTARSANRAKEVGIRKVLGSERKALLYQFIFESVLFAAISTAIALSMVNFSLDAFNELADKSIGLSQHLDNPIFYALILGFILLVGIAAGSYPAFYLSSFNPVETLKGKVAAGFRGKGIRNGLVIFQFSISIALIVCTFFVQKQLAYTSSLDVGFANDNIIQIHNIEQMGFDTETLKTKLEANPAFTNVGKSYGVPPRVYSGDRYKVPGAESEVFQLRNLRTEEDYLDLLALEFIAGRNFDSSYPNDKYKVVINEEAAKTLGWGGAESYIDDSPIGKKLALASGDEDEFEVLGVVKNFNFTSLKEEILPLVIIHHQNDKVWDYGRGLSFYSMRINSEKIKNAEDLQLLIEEVQDQLAEVDGSVPFEFSLMDKEFETAFRSEQRMGKILNLFTFMALTIACLGLFGLAAFSAEQRTKELSIRKVLGARVATIVMTFTSEFTRLILVAILIASPVAYFLVDAWLADFAYRTPIDLWVFLAATLTALIIAMVTISYQSLKTAWRNPAETLKDE